MQSVPGPAKADGKFGRCRYIAASRFEVDKRRINISGAPETIPPFSGAYRFPILTMRFELRSI